MTNQDQVTYEDQVSRSALPFEKYVDVEPFRLFVAVVLVVVIIIIVNISAVFYLKDETINIGQSIVRDKWARIYQIEDPLDYLILGDSTVNQAFDSSIVADELNLHGVNLGTTGTFGFIDDLWLLDTYLELVGVPEVVVIVHSFDVPQREVSIIELLGTYAIPLSSNVMNSPVSNFSDFVNIMKIYQRRSFPLLYRNESLIAAINLFLREGSEGFEQKHFFTDDGYMPWEYERDTDDGFNLEPFKQQIEAGLVSGQFSAQNLHAIDEIIRLAEEYDFDVVFANGTTYIGLETFFSPVRQEFDDQYRAFASRSPKVRYIPNTFTFPLEAMASIDHINADFADDYTKELMALVWTE